jgi:hypothetical protein
MSIDLLNAVRVAGLLGIIGAVVYAVGDVLLLATKADLAAYPNLQPYAKLLSGSEKMVVLSSRRMMWGGLLGIFATPLVVAGFWSVYQGLQPAGAGAALPPAVLFVCASIVGAFVHGSFIYLGEYVQALNQVSGDSQAVIAGMVQRHKQIMIVTYGFLMACIVVAAIWFSLVVAAGQTLFPTWLALVNPVTAFAAWMIIRKLLPNSVTARVDGAGFNIAYLIFFTLTTITLWQAGQ